MNKGFKLLMVSALLLASSAVQAQFYVGGGIGLTDYGADGFDDPISYTLNAGFKFNDYFAIQGAWSDYGSANNNGDPVWILDASAFNFSAIAMYPVTERFDIYAKGGISYWDGTVRAKGYGKLDSDDGWDPSYGFGLDYFLTDSFGTYLEYEITDLNGENTDTVWLGVTYSFN